MSRIGKNPVAVPNGVEVKLDGQDLTVKGKNGVLSMTYVDVIEAVYEDNQIIVRPRDDSREGRIMWGMQRTLTQNLVTGVSEGFTVELEINGVGYRAAVQGREVVLQLGFSHEIRHPIPDGVEVKCEKPTSIKISGADKQVVGQCAAEIRAYRPPEPFKGKGVKYAHETIFRKEGKKK